MKDDIEIDFDEFATIYNEKGKSEAIILAREKYNLSFQQVRRRLNNKSDYFFDTNVRQYKLKSEASIESNFMTIDELECHKAKISVQKESMPFRGLVLIKPLIAFLTSLSKID